jgi:DNA polymerase-3 subunit epsilon
MPLRQIILDTETTGLRIEDGHRIIEIGCLEMIDRKLSGRHFHRYLNPERDIEAAALAVHGISSEFLKDKPLFSDIASELMNFISGAELIIHNAPFDLSFMNQELKNLNANWKEVTAYCAVIDTLVMARQLHVGQRNNLDALCKRYGIDHSKRDLHGALLDAHLLAHVYLAMTGGQGSFFDDINEVQAVIQHKESIVSQSLKKKYQLVIIHANEMELSEHQHYLESMRKQAKVIWSDE